MEEQDVSVGEVKEDPAMTLMPEFIIGPHQQQLLYTALMARMIHGDSFIPDLVIGVCNEDAEIANKIALESQATEREPIILGYDPARHHPQAASSFLNHELRNHPNLKNLRKFLVVSLHGHSLILSELGERVWHSSYEHETTVTMCLTGFERSGDYQVITLEENFKGVRFVGALASMSTREANEAIERGFLGE